MRAASSAAFDLFSPFLRNGAVDKRLLQVCGIPPGTDYEGHFARVLDPEESTSFDFYMEARSGRRIFFDLKLAESSFGICADDERHRQKLAHHYRPHLHQHVDAKWLEPATFFANCEVLSKLSYLGRYADSGLAFIFPRANEKLMASQMVIKQIVSKSLAPRLAIFYSEYLVERILAAVADDEALCRHFVEFRKKYLIPQPPRP
jgi:hypothetical protein